jgi:hypothetical protein
MGPSKGEKARKQKKDTILTEQTQPSSATKGLSLSGRLKTSWFLSANGPNQTQKRAKKTRFLAYDGDKRKVVMPTAKDVMDEVCRIFSYPRTPPTLWDKHGYLKHVNGLENTR